MSLNNLAFLLRVQGDLEGARPLYERALIHEKVLGREHPTSTVCVTIWPACNSPSAMEALR
jgi:hypothetical protein